MTYNVILQFFFHFFSDYFSSDSLFDYLLTYHLSFEKSMVVFHRIFPLVYALFCLPKSILLIYYDRICHHSKKPERNFLPDFSITFLFNFYRYVQILHFFYISNSSLRLLISISG